MRSTSSSETEEGEERAAGFVLFRTIQAHHQFLLLHHRRGGHWAFPKGRLEPGEEELVAALREISEETSVDQLHPIPGFRETSSYRIQRNGHQIGKTVTYFLAETSEPDVSLSAEHTDFQWLGFEDAMILLTHNESRRILGTARLFLDERTGRCEQGVPQVYPSSE